MIYTARVTLAREATLMRVASDREHNRYINSNLRDLRCDTRTLSRKLSASGDYTVIVEVLNDTRDKWINPEVFKNGYQTY